MKELLAIIREATKRYKDNYPSDSYSPYNTIEIIEKATLDFDEGKPIKSFEDYLDDVTKVEYYDDEEDRNRHNSS